jgi:hypothetical protein
MLRGRRPKPADSNHLILTGENPFIRLSESDGGRQTKKTLAAYRRKACGPLQSHCSNPSAARRG